MEISRVEERCTDVSDENQLRRGARGTMSQLGNDYRASQQTDQQEDTFGARRRLGVATMEAPERATGAASGVLGAPTSHLDIAGHVIYSAHPAPTDSLPIAAARDAMQALALLD